jgi:hypothetical protein
MSHGSDFDFFYKRDRRDTVDLMGDEYKSFTGPLSPHRPTEYNNYNQSYEQTYQLSFEHEKDNKFTSERALIEARKMEE